MANANTITTAGPMAPRLVTTAAAAAALGVGKTKLFELISSGPLGSVMVDGRRLIPVAAIDAFVAGLEAEWPTVSAKLFTEHVVAVQPSLVRVVGSVTRAAVVQQIYFYAEGRGECEEFDGKCFVKRTYAALAKDIGRTAEQVRRTRRGAVRVQRGRCAARVSTVSS